jgi:hypothetical protein
MPHRCRDGRLTSCIDILQFRSYNLETPHRDSAASFRYTMSAAAAKSEERSFAFSFAVNGMNICCINLPSRMDQVCYTQRETKA